MVVHEPGMRRRPPGGPFDDEYDEYDSYDDEYDDVVHAHSGVRNAGMLGRPGGPRRPARGSAWTRFVRRHGWRAYALPILAVITVVALLAANHSGAAKSGTTAFAHKKAAPAAPAHPSVSSPPVASGSITLKQDHGGKVDTSLLKAAALPAGAAYTFAGKGTFRTLKGTSRVVGTHGRLYRYSIDVENGVSGIDLAAFAKDVDSTLDDPRSWSGHTVRLQRVDSGSPDFHVTLTSAKTVRGLCGYTIPVETSCYAAAGSAKGLDTNRVVINDARWVRGSTAYIGDLDAYRTYMINHEDGHAMGHEHAHQCLPGGLAPAMMQQTFGLRSAVTGKLCQANPWPFPPGAAGAPGAEQPDTAKNDEYGLGD